VGCVDRVHGLFPDQSDRAGAWPEVGPPACALMPLILQRVILHRVGGMSARTRRIVTLVVLVSMVSTVFAAALWSV
jgi:hypothetical protein